MVLCLGAFLFSGEWIMLPAFRHAKVNPLRIVYQKHFVLLFASKNGLIIWCPLGYSFSWWSTSGWLLVGRNSSKLSCRSFVDIYWVFWALRTSCKCSFTFPRWAIIVFHMFQPDSLVVFLAYHQLFAWKLWYWYWCYVGTFRDKRYWRWIKWEESKWKRSKLYKNSKKRIRKGSRPILRWYIARLCKFIFRKLIFDIETWRIICDRSYFAEFILQTLYFLQFLLKLRGHYRKKKINQEWEV